jgi:hypothetical protein
MSVDKKQIQKLMNICESLINVSIDSTVSRLEAPANMVMNFISYGDGRAEIDEFLKEEQHGKLNHFLSQARSHIKEARDDIKMCNELMTMLSGLIGQPVEKEIN